MQLMLKRQMLAARWQIKVKVNIELGLKDID